MTQKPSLVLLPGLLNDEMLWHNQIDYLKKDWNIFVPDLTKEMSISLLAQSVLKQVQGHFILAGLSMGGYIALEIMRRAPERVQKLALINTSARPDTPEQTKTRQSFIQLAGEGKFKGVTRKLLPALISPENLDNVRMAQTIMDMASRVGKDSFINQQIAIMSRINSVPYLPQIHCPVLVIGGEHDKLTPPEVQVEIADCISDCKIEILKAAGHLSPLEQPEGVNQLMKDWLNS